MRKLNHLAVAVLCCTLGSLMARDYGPATGSKMPDFELQDQNGKAHSLYSLLGPKGAVILFYRSADW